MSRTIRCKNHPWGRFYRYTKIAGVYTQRDYVRDKTSPLYGHYIYREPTKEERVNQYLWMHGESRDNNARSPGKWYRRNREIKLRRASERELQLFMIDPDNYEPMVEFHPRSCYWDWC